jgi:NADH:ubiquinone reductase (H+-translocating)
MPMDDHVVVVGGGFGGLQAALALRGVNVTLIDRRSFHLFQPLAYQVATGVLSPDEIAAPLRRILRRRRRVHVVLGDVTEVDVQARRVVVAGTPAGGGPRSFPYDRLIVAAGSTSSYFGHDEWRERAPDIKSLEGALDVRRRIASAFEAAELDPEHREGWLTFVVVGGGPTGVELAGQIAELARESLRRDYRGIDTGAARIVLVERNDRLLADFAPSLSARTARDLQRLGVSLVLGAGIVDVDSDCVTLEDGRTFSARTVVWAAGVVAADLAATLADVTGAELARGGRIAVGPDLTVAGHPEIMALGDMAQVHDARGVPVPLPGIAPVAMQQGRYAAERVRGARGPFRYRDKGKLATIGRAKAVADLGRVRLSGLPAWLMWLGVHLFYLIGLQNRLVVMVRWTFSYLTRAGGERLVAQVDRVSVRSSAGDR